MKKRKFDLQNLTQLFRVLSDATRLRLVMTLKEQGELHVTGLCERLGLPQPTVSHHLGLLRMAGLVNNRRNGKLVLYSMNDEKGREAAEAVAHLLPLP